MRLFLALGPLLLLTLSPNAVVSGRRIQPNILFIMADDLGWGDTSWSNQYADMHTPKLEEMKSSSVQFMQYYTQTRGSAARAAFLTGRYPFKMGLQTKQVFNRVVNNTLDYEHKLLPQYLKDLGYYTHMVGKWQLGHCNVNATPIRRGFDTHFGSFTNLDDHYNLTSSGSLDWNWNNEPYWQGQNTYSTHLITNHTQFLLTQHFQNSTTKRKPIFLFVSYLAPHAPIQAPDKYINNTKCRRMPEEIPFNSTHNVTNIRRTYCGMVAALDEGVGKILGTLTRLGVRNKFLTIVTSDNGASIENGGSNWPLRGNKQTVYEGGVRVRTLLQAPRFLRRGKKVGKYHGLIHVTDLLPTLLEAAMGNLSVLPSDIDGMSAWQAIRDRRATNRTWMVYNIDSSRQLGALRFKNGTDDFKFIFSNDSQTSEPGFRSPNPLPAIKQQRDKRKKRYNRNGTAYFLYNMATNPDERPPYRNNTMFPDAALANPAMLTALKDKLTELTNGEVNKVYVQLGQLRKRTKGGFWRIIGC